MEEEEKLNTYVFGNGDGSKTVYYMHENVKYKDSKGNIKNKALSLVKKDKGYGIAQNEVDLFLPESPSEGIEVEYSGHTVKIIPQNGDNNVVAKQEGDAVLYEKYFDEKSSLRYTPLLSGVKEDIILSCYAENISYNFLIETENLYMYNDNKGYYLAENAEAEPLFYLGDVEVYDAIGKPCMGTMEVTELEAGKKYSLTISVDDEFLSDPTTVYPVTIDPTLTISDTATGADSIIDAPIFAGYPSRNFGKYKYNTIGTTTASYGIGRTVVKLPGLLNSEEYKAVSSDQIESVKFYVRDSSGTGSQKIYLYQLSNSSWTETSVTWENIGYYYSMGTSATLSSGKVTAFDISSLVRAWKDNKFNPNAGFIMMNQTETNNKSFCSSEYSTTSYRPYVDNESYKDEWLVNGEESSVALERQEESNWCWAACARMASMKYMDSQISQASAAVKVKLGEKTLEPSESQRANANKTANQDEIKEALEYVLGSNNVYCTDKRIYSEAVLRSLLDASNVVLIGRGLYDDSGNRESGHVTILIGYQWKEEWNAYQYEVLDPNMTKSETRSYQGICNGRKGMAPSDTDNYIWEDVVVFKIGNYTDTISWPGVESLK